MSKSEIVAICPKEFSMYAKSSNDISSARVSDKCQLLSLHEFHFNPSTFQNFKSSFARSLMQNQAENKATNPKGDPIIYVTNPETTEISNGNIRVPDNDLSNCTRMCKTAAKQSSYISTVESNEEELRRLRKQCMKLREENNRLLGQSSNTGKSTIQSADSSDIETVVLQSQVNALQWQLKQVEASRQMYRAVMEDIVRFLDHCHTTFASMQKQQITRSDASQCYELNPRSRSSTNLSVAEVCLLENVDENTNSTTDTAHNNFKDFMWYSRCAASFKVYTMDFDPDKIVQEAFRLLRTTQNLLSTQEPDLLTSKCTSDLQSRKMLPNQLPQTDHSQNHFDSEEMYLFARKINIRESHLSLPSSAEFSLHSTLSSKTETDEESSAYSFKEGAISSVTEDESGFSSISSFQEIGVPFNSTMIVPTMNSFKIDISRKSENKSLSDSRNSTLKLSKRTATYEIGLPCAINKRWLAMRENMQSPSSVHNFSTLSSDQSTSVLWV